MGGKGIQTCEPDLIFPGRNDYIATMTTSTNLLGLSADELKSVLIDAGVPEKAAPMRVRQLWNWIYVHGARDFAAMTNLAKDFRAEMAERFVLARPEVVTEQISNDGTRKWLLRTGPGIEFETVFIPEPGRGTLCVSSQVGCTLNCRFCHTGTQKLVRNLTPAEIVGQLMVARDALGDWPSTAPGRKVTNVVMMGMGEPLYNFENVKAALALVTDGDGLALSKRRVTLSTAGVVPMIARAGNEIGSSLAISLHAVRDEIRDVLVPINKKYPLEGIDRGVPQLSRRVECAPHHLRICDAERHQRQPGRRARAGEADRRHSRQDQPDPIQSLARRAL